MITPHPMPTQPQTIACRDALTEPAKSPRFHREATWLDMTTATTPRGRRPTREMSIPVMLRAQCCAGIDALGEPDEEGCIAGRLIRAACSRVCGALDAACAGRRL